VGRPKKARSRKRAPVDDVESRPPPRAAARAAAPAGAPAEDDYFARTRALAPNLLFLAPWVLVYALCWWVAGDSVETEAASWLRSGLRLFGKRALFTLTLVTALGLAAFVVLRVRDAKREVGLLPLMLAEGAFYGLLLFGAATLLSHAFPVGRWIGLFRASGPLQAVGAFGTAIGAGIFEELVFRGVVLTAVLYGMKALAGADRWSASAVAVVLSAALFSAYHHWGAGGEPWDAARFTFRFHAGVILGIVFRTRGLGIAAFAHGAYDALVLL
jgi:membrane protease YdiL (CAAX protease family)